MADLINRERSTLNMVKRGDIIQANENAKDWCGCVLIVDEVRKWGVQAFLRIPMRGDAYIRLPYNAFDKLGAEAVMMPAYEYGEEES